MGYFVRYPTNNYTLNKECVIMRYYESKSNFTMKYLYLDIHDIEKRYSLCYNNYVNDY